MGRSLDMPLAISGNKFDYGCPFQSTSITSKFSGLEILVAPRLPLFDLTFIDIVIVSHNHYDHLDRETASVLVEQQVANPPFCLVLLGLKKWFGGKSIELVIGS